MTDKSFWWKVLLISVLLGMAVLQLHPPQQRLKGGIDLMGGHSLLYEIDDAGITGERRRNLAERVMTILKERVDPKGQRNLVWRPIGGNRLEIQIPKPPEEVVQARRAYKAVRGKLADTELTKNQIRVALARKGDKRDKALESLVRGDSYRDPLITPLAGAYDSWQSIQAKSPDTDVAESAYEKYREAEDALLKTNINVQRVEDILDMGKGAARDTELGNFKKEHPSLASLIDEMTAAFDPWNAQRGALDDPADLKRLLMGAGVLEYRILPTRDPQMPNKYDTFMSELQKRGPRAKEGDQYAWFEIKNPAGFLRMEDVEDFDAEFQSRKAAGTFSFIVDKYADKFYVLASSLENETILAPRGREGAVRWSLESAMASRDSQTNQPCVLFNLDERGGNLMESVSRANLKRPLCIMLDEVAYSAPILQSVISQRGQITGDFTMDDVMYLVNTLEAGSLPARLKPTPIMEKSIGPSLGLTNRSKGIKAATLGLICVVVFMLVYYMHAGFLANIAVLMNLVMVLGIMAMLQATFTLPGIAGLILTVGMAVDANVLIFERIREESRRGSNLKAAVKAGYEKALSTILDANITTLITCVILGYVGSEEVRGFAYTLGFGIATSMFTSLFVTRQFFSLMLPERIDRESITYPLYGIGGLLVSGGVLYGLGLLLGSTTGAAGVLGEFLLVCGVAGVGLFGLMWACRIVFRATGKGHPQTVPMLRLIGRPDIDWMGKRRVFWPISATVVFCGLAFFVYQDQNHSDDLYSIEFLGGTAAQIEVKRDADLIKDKANQDDIIRQAVTGSDEGSAATWLRVAAEDLRQANVEAGSMADEYVVTAGKLNARQIESFILTVFEDQMERREGEAPSGNSLTVQIKPSVKVVVDDVEKPVDLDAVRKAVSDAADHAAQASTRMRQAGVQIVELEREPGAEPHGPTFEITTTETSSRVVREAIVAAFGNSLVIQPAVSLEVYKAAKAEKGKPAADGMFPIEKPTLGQVLNNPKLVGAAAATDVSAFSGGVAFVLRNLKPAISAAAISVRLQQMRLQPDFEAYAWRDFRVIPLAQTATGECTSAAVIVADEHYRYDESAKNWLLSLAVPEVKLAQAAMETGKSLQKVTRFSPSVAQQSKTRALAAIVLALAAIVGYIWLRFGSMTFGLCAIAALIHDVSICVGLIALSHFVHDTFFGRMLGITDFRIDLSMIAAFLTIIGYSLNDTIVVFDRIRENRGKLATVDIKMVSNSINQTLSRTVLTSLTTLLVIGIMYVFGGPGIHGFSYALIVGVIVGTYSSIGIAGALLVSPSALRVFYYVVVGGILSAVLIGMGSGTEVSVGLNPILAGYAALVGAAILAAALIFGELTTWRDEEPPSDVWLAAFGWLAAVIVTWMVTAMISVLAESTTSTMIGVRIVVALGAGLAGAAIVVRATNQLKPATGRVTA